MAYCLLQSVALNPIASLHAATGTAAGNKYISGKGSDAGMSELFNSQYPHT